MNSPNNPNNPINPTGEKSNHKLAAAFESRADAEQAGQKLVDETSLEPDQISVLDPESPEKSAALLPESRGIWRTWLRAHAVFGIAGVLVGLGFFVGLYVAGVAFVADNPVLAGIVFLVVFTLLGLMIGGLVSMRPDQIPYIRFAREALESGQSVLVVHARSREELSQAGPVVEKFALKVVRTA